MQNLSMTARSNPGHQAPLLEIATYNPRASIVRPDALASTRARRLRAGAACKSRLVVRTASTSTSVLRATQRVPMMTSCFATACPGTKNCGKNARKKEQGGLHVESLHHNAVAYCPAHARGGQHRRLTGRRVGMQQPQPEENEVSGADVLDDGKRECRLDKEQG